jgi:hypothetical protein
MTQQRHKVDDVADREDEDGSELTVRGLALPQLLVSLLDSGRWRHPGDDVLGAVVPWFEDPLHFLRSPAAMRSESYWLFDDGSAAGALLVGTMIGPAVVQAATAGLVRLEGGGSSHVAKVSSSGQLSVNPGLAQTAAHQILAAQASPSSYVNVVSVANCSKNGIYKIPPGRALIIAGAEFSDVAATPGTPESQILQYGPPASPCTQGAARVSKSRCTTPACRPAPTGAQQLVAVCG